MVLERTPRGAADLQQVDAPTYQGEDLIFVISQPRSGSTLLQRVLAGHPDIQTSAETWLMLHPAYELKSNGLRAEFDSRWRAQAVAEFLDYYTDGRQVLDEAIRAWAAVIYGNALRKSGRSLFLDKTPRYYFIIPELYRLFPKARFVFLLRNPMAVLASELETYVKERWQVLAQFAPDLLVAPRLILDGMALLGDAAVHVRYEDFVARPAETLEAMCSELRISFHPTMLEYANTEMPKGIMNDPVGVHRHTRPSTSSMEKWREMVSDLQTLTFARGYLEDLGESTISQMGYSFDDIARTLGEGPAFDGGQVLFPWRVALTPRADWTARQRFQAERWRLVQREGRARGTIMAVRRAARRSLQNARQQLAAG